MPDMTDYNKAKVRIKQELDRTLLLKLKYKVFLPYTNELLIFLMQLWKVYKRDIKTDKSGQAKYLSKMHKEIKDLNLLLDKEFPFLEVDKIIYYKKGSKKKITISQGHGRAIVLKALKYDKSLRNESEEYIIKGSPKESKVTTLKEASRELLEFINDGFLLIGPIFRAEEISKNFKSKDEKYTFIAEVLSIITEELENKTLSLANIKKYLNPVK